MSYLRKILGAGGIGYGLLALVLSYFYDVNQTPLWWGQVLAALGSGGSLAFWEQLPKLSLPSLSFLKSKVQSEENTDTYLQDMKALQRIQQVLRRGGDSESTALSKQLAVVATKMFDLYHPFVLSVDEVQLPDIKNLVEDAVKKEVKEFLKTKFGDE